MEENKELQNQNQNSENKEEKVENSQNANEASESKEQIPEKKPDEVSEPSVEKDVQPSEEPKPDEVKEKETEAESSGSEEKSTEEEAEGVEASEKGEPDEKDEVAQDETQEQEPETSEPKPEQESASPQKEPADDGQSSVSGEGQDVITHHENEDIYGDDAHQESDEEEEHQEELTEEELNNKTREELLELMKEAVQEEYVNKVKKRIALIRSAFVQKTKDKKQEDYEKFVDKGAEDEEFVEQPDELDEQFNSVFSVYRQKKAEFNRQQEELKKVNLEKKNEILEKLRELISSEESLKKTYDEFKNLQGEWRAIGMVPRGEVSELWRNYHFLVEKFFDKVKINQELRDLGLKKNLERKIDLCEKAEELLLEDNINKSFKLLQKYHQKWREIGAVPQDKNEEIWQRFKAATDKINERRRDYYEERNEQREENYKAKLALCEKVEELYAEERKTIKDWLNATDRVNELFKLWKSIGKAPGKQNDEVWHRFKTSLDKFFTDKKEYFKELKSYQKDNYNKKLAIIERAEELKDSEDWKATKSELIELQKQWKKIGPVPRKHSEKVWKTFRAACDHFFNRRDEYFKNVHQHEDENLKKKQEIIEKVKAFELSGNKNQDIETLKNFQREWSEVGFVPIKAKDKIQKEFKEALDKHFDKLNVSNIEKNVLNYKQKVEQIKEDPNAGDRIGRERKVLYGKIKQLEEDLQLWENNIGFLANSKKSNQLKSEFEKKIERAKKELAMLKAKQRYLDNADE